MSATPEKEIVHVLQLQHRIGSFAQYWTEINGGAQAPRETLRLCDSDYPIDLGDGLPIAIPEPSLEFEFRERTAGFNEQPTKVTVEASYGLLLSLVSGRAFQKIHAKILRLEIDSTSGLVAQSAPVYTMEVGDLIDLEYNTQGKDNHVKFSIRGDKMRMETEAGRLLLPQCDWSFGDPKTCGVDLSALAVAINIVAVSGRSITVTEVTPSEVQDKPDYYWPRGFLYVDGLTLTIYDWDGALTFETTQLPPEDWALTVPFSGVVIPGCRKIPFDCRRFGAEASFGGLGVAIPAHNPVLERGGAG